MMITRKSKEINDITDKIKKIFKISKCGPTDCKDITISLK